MIRIGTIWTLVVVALLAGVCAVAAQQDETAPPELPPIEEIEEQSGYIYDPATDTYIPRPQPDTSVFVPMDFDFRIGVVGDYIKEVPTAGGVQTQVKTPLILIDPRNGDIGVYAKNFPARIVTHSDNGNWVVGVAESSSVEGSSGSRQRECAVSLDMNEGDIEIIQEFPLFSKFQAYFTPTDDNAILYCVNEPAVVNSLVRYNLRNQEEELLPTEGNRFYLYGLKQDDPRGIWVEDPFSVADYPVVNLVNWENGTNLDKVKFPGSSYIVPSPMGDVILAVVENRAEASIGYYKLSDHSFHQVRNLVLTRPTVKWAHTAMAVIAKESTATRDRFLWIDLETGNVQEIWSDYFKIAYWDISPEDDALVFIIDSETEPVLYVVPLDQSIGAINCIRLTDVSNVSWIGCLSPPRGGGSWLDRLLPF